MVSAVLEGQSHLLRRMKTFVEAILANSPPLLIMRITSQLFQNQYNVSHVPVQELYEHIEVGKFPM